GSVVGADGDVAPGREAPVVDDSSTGVGGVAVDRDIGEIHVAVSAEPAATGCRVAAQRYTVQGGGALVEDAAAKPSLSDGGVIADRHVCERQVVAVRYPTPAVGARVLRHDDIAEVQGNDVVAGAAG